MHNIPNKSNNTGKKLMISAALFLSVAGCTPTIKVEAPEKPIEINLNIKIEQEVRVKVDNDLEAAFASDPALFGAKGAAKEAPKAAPAAVQTTTPAPVTAPAPVSAPKTSHQLEGNK